MTQSSEERQLRAIFSGLRKEDAQSAPTFAATVAAGRREKRVHPGRKRREHPGRERRWIIGAGVVPIAAGAALAIWLTVAPESPGTANRMDVALTVDEDLIVDWSSPTDDLLEMPGGDFLSTVPTLGDGADFGVEFPEDSNPGADAAAIGLARRYA